MAIDIWAVSKVAVRQVPPHAALVVDHFHVVQLANRAVTGIRRRVTLTQRGRSGRSRDPEWRMRNRLTRTAARMLGKLFIDETTFQPGDVDLDAPGALAEVQRRLALDEPRNTQIADDVAVALTRATVSS
ncbi:transposase [Micromonospora sp. NPDC000316]|uniref:transposase n=1 Tax=Micromonospora sp. NPDC000316 TaxID=3364216 RepID=UPI0036BAE41A